MNGLRALEHRARAAARRLDERPEQPVVVGIPRSLSRSYVRCAPYGIGGDPNLQAHRRLVERLTDATVVEVLGRDKMPWWGDEPDDIRTVDVGIVISRQSAS